MSLSGDCQTAIRAYFAAYYTAMGFPLDIRAERKVMAVAERDAEFLLRGGDDYKERNRGLRYGAPGWPNLELHFDADRGFWLESRGMDVKKFLQFQDVVAQKFEVDGLDLYKMPA
jgi:hypothetical protein